jgi:hypothetical protein
LFDDVCSSNVSTEVTHFDCVDLDNKVGVRDFALLEQLLELGFALKDSYLQRLVDWFG